MTSDGKLGLGNTSPTGNIHISDIGSVSLILESDTDDTDETHQPSLSLLQDGGSVGMNIGFLPGFNSGNTFALQRRYGNTDYDNTLAINTQTGNVGVGTNTPTETLHVEGSIKVTGCPSDMVKYGGWCMDTTSGAAATYKDASEACSAEGKQLCPGEVYYLCDAVNGSACAWSDVGTDTHWGAGYCAATGSWHGNFCVYVGDNTRTTGTSTETHAYQCCKPLP